MEVQVAAKSKGITCVFKSVVRRMYLMQRKTNS